MSAERIICPNSTALITTLRLKEDDQGLMPLSSFLKLRTGTVKVQTVAELSKAVIFS